MLTCDEKNYKEKLPQAVGEEEKPGEATWSDMTKLEFVGLQVLPKDLKV